MAKICELKISNFRGIKTFSQKISSDFVCFLGRGDSGKTTILEAVSLALSPNWNPSFYDSDFYNGDINKDIIIEISLLDLPEKLLKDEKYGLYIRGYTDSGEIQDELIDNHLKVLTIKLEVKKDLEPQWYVVNERQEPVRISAIDRAKLNVFMISDMIERHFSWSKGSPLHAILQESRVEDENRSVMIEALREAKSKIDQGGFNQFADITDKLKILSDSFGVDISGAKTTIDFKDVTIKDGRVCLHDGIVPLRLKGKGTKRLISMAIQMILAEHGGIILIDEVEQGLESDRIKHLIRTIKNNSSGQIFITTHSCDVITELKVEDLAIVNCRNGDVSITAPNDKFQKIVRSCPEAMFAEKIIVCEGKTEIGICRAINSERIKKGKESMVLKKCVHVLGEGGSFAERADNLKKLGLKVCVFCDSDNDSEINPNKATLKSCEINIVDCESNNNIEKQLFSDLPWKAVLELVDYAIEKKYRTEGNIIASIKSKFTGTFPSNFRDSDTPEIRCAIANVSNIDKNEWFKRIDHGEFVGSIIFKYMNEIKDKKLGTMINSLFQWIDE